MKKLFYSFAALNLGPSKTFTAKHVRFTAIPYYAQDNRQSGEMEVWVAEHDD